MSQTKAQLIDPVDLSIVTADLADDAVTAAKLASNAVVNASVDASAAIAGTKISPDFGSQAITTTGAANAFAINVTGNNQDSLNFTGTSTNSNRGIAFNSKTALSHGNDNNLRINNNTEFSSINIFAGDNATGAFTLKQGSNEYITVDTNNSSELITLGNTTTNPKTAILGTSVGIGTTSPGSILHVQPLDETNFLVRNESSTLVLASETNSGRDNNRGMALEATAFEFIEGGSEKMRLDSSGRLLLGTTTEGFAEGDDLTIKSSDHGGITIRTPSNKEGNIAFSDATSGTGEYSGLIRYRHANDDLGLWTASNLRLLINSSGKVGINTTSPAALLTLNVDTESNLGSGSEGIRLTSGSSNAQFVRLGSSYSNNSVTGPGTLLFSSNKLSLRCDNGNPITFHTGSTVSERMRIDSSGRVGIGTTSPDAPLTIHNSSDPEIRFGYNSSQDHRISWDGSKVFIHADPENANGSSAIALAVDGTARLYITDAGNVGIGTTSPSSIIHGTGSNSGVGYRFINSHATSGFGVRIEGGGTTADRYALMVMDAAQNERFRVNANGNLGIGTASPATILHVKANTGDMLRLDRDNSGAVGNQIAFRHKDGSNNLVETCSINAVASSNAADGNLRFSTKTSGGSNAEKMRITQSGNVGIGTTTPSYKLEVSAETAISGDVRFLTGSRHKFIGGGSGNNLELGTYGQSNTSRNIAMVMDSASRVGIGTGSPSAKLHIAEDASGTTDMLILHANADGAGENNGIASIKLMGDAEHAAFIKGGHISNGNTILTFHTDAHDSGKNPQERMRILDDGGVVINSSTRPVVGREMLGVFGGSASDSIGIGATCSNNNGIPFFASNPSNSGSRRLMRFAAGSNGDTRGTILFNGSTLIYGTSSDYRLKKNVQQIADGITKLKQLNPITFDWIRETDNNNVMGFLAHEVQEVISQVVSGTKDAVDSKGNPQYQEINYGGLTPLLTAALKEAITKIETLETKVAALEAA